ncbi:MAG: TetR family transcriptional regulator [Propionicimonas sp.]|nr:TetR family transcriptional regulator [Propionicimonas sp.]
MVQVARGLTADAVVRLEERGLVTATFRRLAPDRQQAVVLAILDEAFGRGPSRLRLKEAAQAAGVAVGSLYQYFGNRQGVIDFTVSFAAGLLADELRGYVPSLVELPLADGLRAWVGGGLEWSSDHSAVMRFFARAAYEGDAALEQTLVAPIAQAMLEAVTAMLQEAQRRGEVRADVDLPVAASVVHAALSATADAVLLDHLGTYLLPARPAVEAGRTLEATVDLLCRGLA